MGVVAAAAARGQHGLELGAGADEDVDVGRGVVAEEELEDVGACLACCA